MKYVTTKCPHCGYQTRTHDSGTQKVELGQTLFRCPKCHTLMLDPIDTEYEFMTDYERGMYASNTVLLKAVIGNLLFIGGGIFMLIAALTLGKDYLIICLIFSILLFGFGFSGFWKVYKVSKMNAVKLAILYSLLRTSNAKYVQTLNFSYDGKRTYRKINNRNSLISEYQKYAKENIQKIKEDIDLELQQLLSEKSN